MNKCHICNKEIKENEIKNYVVSTIIYCSIECQKKHEKINIAYDEYSKKLSLIRNEYVKDMELIEEEYQIAYTKYKKLRLPLKRKCGNEESDAWNKFINTKWNIIQGN